MVSCSSIGGYSITKREAVDNEIQAARADVEAKMLALKEKEDKLLRDTITAHIVREQAAADYLFKGSVVFGGLRPELVSRPTLIMGQSIQQTAAQLPSATPTAQAAAFKALQTELDEVKMSTEALRLQYEAELGVAREEGRAKAKALEELEVKTKTIEEEKVKVLVKAREVERTLQEKKDEIQEKELAISEKETERAKSTQAIKTKMSMILGAIALACLAGAIWSPVFKDKFGIGAAVLGFCAIAIWYIEGWMVGVAGGAVLLGIIAWAAKNHYIESKAATNVYRAVQSFKESSQEEYDKLLKPKLSEWMTVYNKKTGKLLPDNAAIEHVDKVLMDVGDK